MQTTHHQYAFGKLSCLIGTGLATITLLLMSFYQISVCAMLLIIGLNSYLCFDLGYHFLFPAKPRSTRKTVLVYLLAGLFMIWINGLLLITLPPLFEPWRHSAVLHLDHWYTPLLSALGLLALSVLASLWFLLLLGGIFLLAIIIGLGVVCSRKPLQINWLGGADPVSRFLIARSCLIRTAILFFLLFAMLLDAFL